jgi:serine phosphatase RsbU (regulator of sigma subunit)
VDTRSPYRQLLEDLRAAAVEPHADVLVERAAAMLAGRVGCRLGEARGHLARMAVEQGRDVVELAAELTVVLEAEAVPGAAQRARSTVNRLARAVAESAPVDRVAPEPVGETDTLTVIEQVLDGVTGAHAWLTPERDAAGDVVDWVVRAASPEAVDVRGRQGATMVDLSIRSAYPSTVGGPVWRTYGAVLADGTPRELGPMDFPYVVDGVTRQSSYSIRVHRAGSGLLIGWIRHDGTARGPDERIAQTERLASLGWGEWDLRTGETTWSAELYRIYERDPALGPMPQEESGALIVPEDQRIRRESAEAFARGETVDMTYRIRIGGRVKHLRAVIDAVRDSAGQPLRLYGIVQDVTSRELARVRLATVERQLREHQETLEVEHRLAANLQQIVLPIPDLPVDLPGLRVALRYVPAERASRVGGDWYHAATGPDGTVLLAVGDVAGHGLQAATTMAQLRHALAALAITTTTEPGELLSHLNRLLCATESKAGTATAVIARYDPTDGLLVWAQAGHPPPLRARAGVTASLTRPRGPLLGAVPDAVYEHATVELAEHDLLLFYTDGLVEDRQRTLEEGLAPVIFTLNEISGRAVEAPLAELLDRLRRANPDDDTCVLAARRQGPPGGATQRAASDGTLPGVAGGTPLPAASDGTLPGVAGGTPLSAASDGTLPGVAGGTPLPAASC